LAPFRALRPPVPSHATAEAPGGSDHKAFLPLGAAMLLASAGSFAQTPPATGVQLPTVTVKESAEIQNKDTLKPTTTTIGKGKQALRDIPQSVTVFTERLMNDRNQDDFRDVLRSTAGVTFQAGETGEEDIRLRGFSLGQAGDIYIDGMKDAPLYERDTFNNDSVEVLKGSASMLFGKGSTGGVVNQVNKMPLLMDQHEASYTLGTGQQHRLTGDFNFLTGENAAFRINALVHDEKNFGAKQKKLGIAPTYSWGVGTRDEFSVGLYALDIQGRPLYDHPWFLDGQRIVPSLPARNYYGLASDKLDSSAQYVTLAHTHRFDNNGELQTRLRHGRYERDLLASAVRFAAGTTRDNLNGDTVVTRSAKGRLGISELTQLQSDYTNTFAWGGRKHAVIAGVDLYYDDARRDQRYTGTGTMPNTTVGTPNDGAVRPTPRGAPTFNTFDASNLGLYVQDTVSVTDTVKLLGGLRYDRFKASYHTPTELSNRRSDGLWSPRLGVIYQPNESSSYYASYGTSYNTSGDTYQFGLSFNNNTERTANTPPEKSRNFEIGGKFDLFDKRALLGIAAFYSEKYNERNTDPDSAAAQELLSGKRHAAGMEVNLAGRITPKWEVFFNHTWIPSARIDESNVVPAASGGGAQVKGDRPGLTPRHSGSLWTTYAVAPQWRLGLGVNYRGEQNPEGQRAMTADSFAVFDAMVEYTVDEKTSIKLNVTNLTNKLYADTLYRGFYGPGAARAAQLTLKTRF
jgi:catecholate siderophore receptor